MQKTGTFIKSFGNRCNWILTLLFLQVVLPYAAVAQQGEQQYKQLQQRLATGWHTYNHQNVLSHVLMPEGLSVTVSFKSHQITGYGFLGDAYVSAKVERPERLTPLAYSANGSYTSLLIEWQGLKWMVQSSATGNDLALLVTPMNLVTPSPEIIVSAAFLWNKPGTVAKSGNTLSAAGARKTVIYQTGSVTKTPLPLYAPYLSLKNDTVGICTGKARSLADIKAIIGEQSKKYEQELTRFGKQAPQVAAIQNALGWNTTYDALNGRVVSPVSRYWTEGFGGPFVLFCWDNYFASYMAGLVQQRPCLHQCHSHHQKHHTRWFCAQLHGRRRPCFFRPFAAACRCHHHSGTVSEVQGKMVSRVCV
jgi:hypothetical protein